MREVLRPPGQDFQKDREPTTNAWSRQPSVMFEEERVGEGWAEDEGRRIREEAGEDGEGLVGSLGGNREEFGVSLKETGSAGELEPRILPRIRLARAAGRKCVRSWLRIFHTEQPEPQPHSSPFVKL